MTNYNNYNLSQFAGWEKNVKEVIQFELETGTLESLEDWLLSQFETGLNLL